MRVKTPGPVGLVTALALLLLLLPWPASAQQKPTAERPVYTLGDKWIRSDGAYELVRIEGGDYVFAAGPRHEVRLTKNLGFTSLQGGRGPVEFAPALEFDWPLRVGASGATKAQWTTPKSGGWRGIRVGWRVEAYEDVALPAGPIKAFKIAYELQLGGNRGQRSITLWYAPEIRHFVKAVSPDVGNFNFVVVGLDRPEPLAVALAAPGDGTRTSTAEAPLRARVTSGKGITRVVVTVNGVEVHRREDPATPKELPLSLVLKLREGRNVVLVSATDAAGETRQEARTLVYTRAQAPTAAGPSAERPTYAIGDRWIRGDGVFRLARIEDGAYVFSAGPHNEVHLSQRLGFAKWVGAARVVAFDPPLDLEWPLRVGASGTIAGRWTTPKSDGWRPTRTTWRVEAYEDVVTQAGTLKAFRITYSIEFAGGAQRSEATVWYAPEARRFVKASSADLPVFSYSLASLDRPAPPAVAAPVSPPPPPAAAPPAPAPPAIVARPTPPPAPLAVRLASPADQTRVEHEKIALAGVVTSGKGVTRVLVTLNGTEVSRAEQAAPRASVALDTSLALREGRNTLVVTATGADGTVMQEVRSVTYEKRMPLTVELRYPDDGARLAEAATVVVGAAASSKGLAKVSVTLNGAEVLPAEQGARAGQTSVSLTVPVTLRGGANVIVVSATDGEGQVRQVVRSVTYQPPVVAAAPAAPAAPAKPQPQRWAVVIGVGGYENSDIPRLTYAVPDAEAVYQVLTGPGGFKKDRVLLLTDKTEKKPTLRNIKWALGTFLARSAGKDDVVLIYFAGHGAPEVDQRGLERDGLAKYLIPADADPDDLFSTALPMDDIQTIFGRIEAERVVTFIDACYSGAAGGRTFASKKTRATNLDDLFLERLTRAKGRAIITASRPAEVSLELPELGHGVFTYFLVRGLEGAADLNRDGIVVLQELYEYVEQQVSRKARAAGGKQNPVMKGELEGSLPLVKTGR